MGLNFILFGFLYSVPNAVQLFWDIYNNRHLPKVGRPYELLFVLSFMASPTTNLKGVNIMFILGAIIDILFGPRYVWIVNVTNFAVMNILTFYRIFLHGYQAKQPAKKINAD
jgi:hypothetical protein